MFSSLVPALIIVGLTVLAFRFVFGFLMRPAGFKRHPKKRLGIRSRVVRALAYIVSRVAHRLR